VPLDGAALDAKVRAATGRAGVLAALTEAHLAGNAAKQAAVFGEAVPDPTGTRSPACRRR